MVPQESTTVSDLTPTGPNLPKLNNSYPYSAQGLLWPSSQSNFFLDYEKTVVMIEQFVKGDFFRWLKFISSPEMIEFSWDKNSICQIVCEKFGVSSFEQTFFWSCYKKTVSQKLNTKCAEICNAMRKVFKGNLNLFNIYIDALFLTILRIIYKL